MLAACPHRQVAGRCRAAAPDPAWVPASVGRPILASENPFPLGTKDGREVVARIGYGVAGVPIADLEIGGVRGGAIDEVMRGAAGGKTEAHPRRELLLAVLGEEGELAFEHENEFVLPAVAVEQRRGGTGR